MLNGIEFQTVGAAYLKALRPTAVLVNGTGLLGCMLYRTGVIIIGSFILRE